MIKQPLTYVHDSHGNSEMIIPLKCFNLTNEKTVTINVNKMDISKRGLRKLRRKLREFIKNELN